MKKIILCFVALLLMATCTSLACNTCGCGVANYQYGILPQSKKSFIGLRYRYRSFTSKLDGSHSSPYSYERFQSAELWARFYPFKRVQVFAFVPYNINERKEGSNLTQLSGLGDIVVSANYALVNTYDSTAAISHSLLIGGGVKLPTGQFRKIQDGLTVNQNFQLGTGSVDFLLSLIHTIRFKRMGLNTEFTYNINTTNRDEYRFGNTSRTAVTAFYLLNVNGLTIMPNAGAGVETFQDNKQYGDPFPDTGGWAILYQAGIESYYKRMAFGLSYTAPGKQELFNGQVTAHERVAAHVTFLF